MRRMPQSYKIRLTLRPRTEDLERWRQAAERERVELREWIARACDLAVARGSTR